MTLSQNGSRSVRALFSSFINNLYGRLGLKLSVSKFPDNLHMKLVRLSAICIGRLYSPGSIPVTHLCLILCRLQCYNLARRIISMENPSDTDEN